VQSAIEFWEDYEVLTVETPENIELKLPLAGFGPRFLALVVDSLLQGVGFVVVFVVAIALALASAPADESAAMVVMLVVMLLGMVLVLLGYFVIFELLWNGQTPGKRLTGIRVVKRGGLPLTFTDSLLRNLLRLVDYFPSYGLVGLVSFFVTRNQQRLGDLVADTVVIREFTRNVPYSWFGQQVGDAGHAGAALSPAISYVIGSYLGRATQLPVSERLTLTERIIGKLGYASNTMSLQEREGYLASLLQWQARGGQ
jgi:uncharacterized RDD family membrane protein YckC